MDASVKWGHSRFGHRNIYLMICENDGEVSFACFHILGRWFVQSSDKGGCVSFGATFVKKSARMRQSGVQVIGSIEWADKRTITRVITCSPYHDGAAAAQLAHSSPCEEQVPSLRTATTVVVA